MMACQVGNLSCAQYLVSKGVDPTVTNKVLVFCPHLCRKYCTIHAVCFLQLQTTALMIACFEGHIPVLEWLLSVGVDPHASDKVRSRVTCATVLTYRTKNSLYLSFSMFYTAVSLCSSQSGWSAFLYACKHGQLEALKWLVSRGVSPTSSTKVCCCLSVNLDVELRGLCVAAGEHRPYHRGDAMQPPCSTVAG